MILRLLTTLNYRNLRDQDMRFEDGIHSISGLNGQGKTNVLEAIYLVLTGVVDAGRLQQLVRFEETEAYVKATLERDEGHSIAEVGIGRGKRLMKLDGIRVKSAELLRGGAVFIAPEDSEIVFGSPSGRRKFLDDLLSKISARYAQGLDLYQKNLAQRNAALKNDEQWALEVFDAKLTELGTLLMDLRQRAIQKIQQYASDAHTRIGGRGELGITLQETTSIQGYARDFLLRRSEEFARQSTVIGPHRDDLVLTLRGQPASDFASRGEARTIALALRYAEYELLFERYQENPILLIDDFSAELDPERRNALIELAKRSPQALITGTEPLPHAAHHYRMEGGHLERIQ
ncbi:DNA replication and repair protein RecF [Deinococcus roseus]|uniref:DNA replication and repair protein RecF n=1 Tax=Deinococcus roseus TaxID=392414 RepID=A0ABQ2CWR1_9DEIO|nr:DNA replication and repair protein RecF [Deinococcus roseus]